MKKLVFVAVIASVLALSYYRSEQVYSFYIKTYYRHIQKKGVESHISTVAHYIKDGKRGKAEALLKDLLVAYPESRRVSRVAGEFFFEKGERVLGEKYLLFSVDKKNPDWYLIERVSLLLFEDKEYGEIKALLSGLDISYISELNYIYGASLFHLGENKLSLNFLERAIRMGYDKGEVYLYISLVTLKSGDKAGALRFAEEAYSRNSENREIKEHFIEMLRVNGRNEEMKRLIKY